MNLQKLRFAVEVEKTLSITQAAKNLYMSQPNLSKSIKELEKEIGITIFNRTARGVAPTVEGLEFLAHAKSILNQMDIMENIYSINRDKTFNFKVSVPRTTYLTSAFNLFMKSLEDSKNSINIHYRETSSEETMSNIAMGNFDIGIIRYQEIYENYFLNRLKEYNLDYEVLWAFKMRVIMSKNHPLSNCSILSYDLLKDYIEIVHGDLQVPNLNGNNLSEMKNVRSKNRIYVFDRGSQYDFLQQIKGAYKWVSPVSDDELLKYNLIQKECKYADITKDLVIYPNKNKLKPHEKEFIRAVKQIIETNMSHFKEDF